MLRLNQLIVEPLYQGQNFLIQFLRSQNIQNLYTFTILCTGLENKFGLYSREDTPMKEICYTQFGFKIDIEHPKLFL